MTAIPLAFRMSYISSMLVSIGDSGRSLHMCVADREDGLDRSDTKPPLIWLGRLWPLEDAWSLF